MAGDLSTEQLLRLIEVLSEARRYSSSFWLRSQINAQIVLLKIALRERREMNR